MSLTYMTALSKHEGHDNEENDHLVKKVSKEILLISTTGDVWKTVMCINYAS